MTSKSQNITISTFLVIFLSFEWNSIRLGGPAHGIVTKTVHKTLVGVKGKMWVCGGDRGPGVVGVKVEVGVQVCKGSRVGGDQGLVGFRRWWGTGVVGV